MLRCPVRHGNTTSQGRTIPVSEICYVSSQSHGSRGSVCGWSSAELAELVDARSLLGGLADKSRSRRRVTVNHFVRGLGGISTCGYTGGTSGRFPGLRGAKD